MSAYSQTATAVVAGPNARRLVSITLAETVSAGMPGYKTSSNTYGKADGNDATKCVLAGYFEQGGATGQKANLITSDDAANLGITFAVGDIAVLGDTPGTWAPSTDETSGDYTTVGGVAKSTSLLNFAPVAAGAPRA